METVICSEGNVKWSLGKVLGKGLSAEVHVATKEGEEKKVVFWLSHVFQIIFSSSFSNFLLPLCLLSTCMFDKIFSTP